MNISSVLRRTLNHPGHGFHYAVLRRVHQLRNAGESGWIFEGSEFPVATGTGVTHIDFVLRTHSQRIYLANNFSNA